MSLRIDKVVKGNIIFHDHPGEDVKGGSVGGVTPIDNVVLDTSYTPTGSESQGTLYWNSIDGTLDVVLNGVNLHTGQQLYFYGKADAAITKGDLVQFAGVQGNHITMKKCVVSEIQANPTYFIGVASENLSKNQFGYVTWFGYVNDVYTDTPDNGDSVDWAVGDILYFSNTTGGLTNTLPTKPDTEIEVAAVTKTQTGNAQNGRILVRPTIYHKLEEASDVDVSGIADGNVLVWDNTNSKWVVESRLSSSDIGVSVQAYDDDLTDIAALTHTKGNLIASNGTDWVNVGVGSNDQVLTADSAQSAGIKWADASGGGTATTTVTITAGETLAEKDYIFIEPDDGKGYKLDIDSSPVKTNSLRGFVTESGGIATDATGEITVIGEITGLTGLTPYKEVYASSTAGGYTQTVPVPNKGSNQIAVILIGVATSSTSLHIINNQFVQYMKRDDVADDGKLVIEHQTDVTGYGRRLYGFVNAQSTTTVVAENDETNRDSNLGLQGPEYAGGNVDISATGSYVVVGTFSNTLNYRQAQQFSAPADGAITEISVPFSTDFNSPTPPCTWEIRSDNSDDPDTLLATGTFTVVPNSENTLEIDGPIVTSGTKYWLIFHSVGQATNTFHSWRGNTSSTYAGHLCKYSVNGGLSWTTQTRTCDFKITVGATETLTKLAQSFQPTNNGNVGKIRLYLKKIGSPTGTLTVSIQTNNSLTVPDKPSGTIITNGTAGTISASSLTSSFAWVEFNYTLVPEVNDFTKYWIVLETSDSQSDTDYVQWASDKTQSYIGGEMLGLDGGTWTSQTKDAIFDVETQSENYIEPINDGYSEATGTDRALFAHHDGDYLYPTTKSAIKNISGGTLDITFVVTVFEEETDDYGSTIYSPTYNTNLNSLLDVDDTNLSNNDNLIWNGTTSKWEMGSVLEQVRDERGVAILTHTVSENTAQPQHVTGWNQREINTINYDPEGYVTWDALGRDAFKLDAGDYIIEVISPSYRIGVNKLRLYNETQSQDEIVGLSEWSNFTYAGGTNAHLVGKVTSNGTDVFRVDHYAQYFSSGARFGYPTDATGYDEIYLFIKIRRI